MTYLRVRGKMKTWCVNTWKSEDEAEEGRGQKKEEEEGNTAICSRCTGLQQQHIEATKRYQNIKLARTRWGKEALKQTESSEIIYAGTHKHWPHLKRCVFNLIEIRWARSLRHKSNQKETDRIECRRDASTQHRQSYK